MTEDEKRIAKMKNNLLQIRLTGKAPINLVQYQEWGLITVLCQNVTTPSGNVESRFDRLLLTEKAKRILAAI